MKTIILTGGGTAGHTLGCVALLPRLRTYFDKIVYIGSENGIEKDIIKKEKDIEYYSIKTTKLRRKFSFKNLAIPFVLLSSIRQCKKLIDKIKPNIIFSKGGYVSVPVVFAGYKKNIPIITHESDITMGLANKLIRNKAKVVCNSFMMKKSFKNSIFSGPLIRESLFHGNKNLKNKMNIPNDIKVLLVMGGSLGASSLNNLVFNNLDFLCSKFFVIHITGRDKAKAVIHSNYAELEYYDKMEDIYAITDFCLTRGGSNALFELLALKIPMIISPLKKQSRGEQIKNADYFCKNGYALILKEESDFELKESINKLISSQNKIKNNLNNATQKNGVNIVFEQIKKYMI